jgi:hypothetical protein
VFTLVGDNHPGHFSRANLLCVGAGGGEGPCPAGVSPNTGKVSYWLPPKAYAVIDYEEAWDRLGNPDSSPKLPA